MKRGNFGFAEELLFWENIKGEVAPQISPRVGENLQLGDPPHGLGGTPRPRERSVSGNEVVKNAPRGKRDIGFAKSSTSTESKVARSEERSG